MDADTLFVVAQMVDNNSGRIAENVMPAILMVLQIILVFIVFRLNGKLETTKSELSREIVEFQTKYSYYHKQQFDGLVRLWQALDQAYRNVINVKKPEDIKWDIIDNVFDTYRETKLFVTPSEFRAECDKAITSLMAGLDPQGKFLPAVVDFKASAGQVAKAAKKAQKELPSLMKRIEEKIQHIISPIKPTHPKHSDETRESN